MDYYNHEFENLQKDFYDAIHNYPLFQEMIDKIFDEDIQEINDLLEKKDEFYLKKAIRKLKDLIEFIKKTSKDIKKEYEIFDKLAKEWEKIRIISSSNKYLDKINNQIKRANSLIKSHNLDEIKEANKTMQDILYDVRNYSE